MQINNNIEIPLTQREKDTLLLVAEGVNNDEIAAALFISKGTVKKHVNSILKSFGVKNRTQAAVYALLHHYII